MHISCIILKVITKSWGDQYIVGTPTKKLGGLVSPGPHGCCAYENRQHQNLYRETIVRIYHGCSRKESMETTTERPWPATLSCENERRQDKKQAVARIADRKLTAKNYRGHMTQATPSRPLSGKLFVRLLGIPDTKLHTNLKSLTQVVFEILRSKRIVFTSLTFQCHVTSSVT